jgi:hypothetical protein
MITSYLVLLRSCLEVTSDLMGRAFEKMAFREDDHQRFYQIITPSLELPPTPCPMWHMWL